MLNKIRDGVSLAYADVGDSEDVLVLIHGWGCDHTTLMRQQMFFSGLHRVVNVDLRGHGESDSPQQTYSVESFADDVAWLCNALQIQRAVIVGHSMGGAVALETALRVPKLVRAVCLIDTAFQASPELFQLLAPLLPGLQGSEYDVVYREIMKALSLPSDLVEMESVLDVLPRAPQHVLLSSLEQHMEAHDFARAAIASGSMPVAYIGAAHPLANRRSLQGLIPKLSIGQTLGSGHFAPWIVHEQVNAMLSRFLELVSREASLMTPSRQVTSQMVRT